MRTSLWTVRRRSPAASRRASAQPRSRGRGRSARRSRRALPPPTRIRHGGRVQGRQMAASGCRCHERERERGGGGGGGGGGKEIARPRRHTTPASALPPLRACPTAAPRREPSRGGRRGAQWWRGARWASAARQGGGEGRGAAPRWEGRDQGVNPAITEDPVAPGTRLFAAITDM
ncbi:hypothetical protein PVAP13_4NG229555 [Panicum virgatum]|uniref:Uncharacterized protein n=1 Tax=Panicum virgatum TaxID=38727 RepID=A0A8T0T4S9_PANVG|nr:hypothetical protein PVAP13_4NG229555 [Panicum virgatum]